MNTPEQQKAVGTTGVAAPATVVVTPTPGPSATQPSNPPAIPTDPEGPAVKDTRTIPQQMSDLREVLEKKYPKHPTTIRLDVTTDLPCVEFLAFNQSIPDVDGQPKRYGVLRAQTIPALTDLIRSLP